MKISLCSACGKPTFQAIYLCRTCKKLMLESRFSLQTWEDHGQSFRSLLTWEPGESDFFSGWIKQVKQFSDTDWNYLAQVWAKEDFKSRAYLDLNGSQDTSKTKTPIKSILNAAFVPCPMTKPGRAHAQRWTQALAQVYGLPVYDILKYSDENTENSQKRKNKKQRSKTQMVICEEKLEMCGLKELRKNKDIQNIIFVDDMVTTGATARAAQNAISKLGIANFYTWSLIQRGCLPSIL